MNLNANLADYWREIVDLVKTNRIVLFSFLVTATFLEFTSYSFATIFLMLILMAVLSKTQEYKSGKCKICNFFLYFAFILVFLLLFTVPATVFLIGLNVTEIEQITNSHLIRISVNTGAWMSLIFVFAPYRIFDANVGLFKALKYSNKVIIENPVIFFILMLFMFVITFIMDDVRHTDFLLYTIMVVATVSLYKLNVKNTLKKETL